jgi:2-dehydropantoate 2-reductase
VVPLQNGLEAATQLAAVLNPQAVVGGTCGIYSFIAEPGYIRHVGLEPSITIGELDRQPSARTRALHAALERAGIAAAVAANIQLPLWEKFLILRWGVVGAITRAPAGVLRRLPQTLDLIDRSCHEVLAVARAHDIVLSDDILERNMALLESLPESATTSFQRDVMDGRPSELDALVDALVRLGKQANVSTPVHQFFSYCLLPMEMKARGEITFSA